MNYGGVSIIRETGELISRNPNTGEIVGSVPVASEADVMTSVSRARAAQPAWAARPLNDRIKMMQQIQEGFVDHASEIASLVSQEMGKVETDSLLGDVLIVLSILTGYLKLAPSVLRPQRQRQGLLHSTKRSYLVHEPLGVVAIISPFNYPILLSMQSAFAALISGNAVVHKPSEFVPLSALKIRDIFYKAGLPQDLFQVVIGAGETGAYLVNSGVDHISFVGSTNTGQQVAVSAAKQLIPVTLELGGNNAMIVLSDAPISRAVECALSYSFASSGQLCASISRLYIHRSLVEDFIIQLCNRLDSWTIADDSRPNVCDMAALVDDVSLSRVETHVQAALEGGAKLVYGGKRLGGTNAPVFPPTILSHTSPEMSVQNSETFGPVLCVIEFDDEEEAVAMANNSQYGLTASIWTCDNSKAWSMARKLDVATVAINDHMWPFFAPEVPWGGIKNSGLGRTGGRRGLESMTYEKVISFDRLNLPREFYWYPRPKWFHFVLLMVIPILYSRKIEKRLKALGRLLSGIRNSSKTQG